MEQIKNTLQLQEQTLRELCDLAHQERNAILDRDKEQIIACLKEKESLQKKLSTLDKQIQTLSEGKTLQQIAATANETDTLLELRQTLKSLVRETHSLNTTNMMLLKNELAYLGQLREILFPDNNNAPYNANGSVNNNKQSELMISTRA